jgi:hypothetical protein
MSVRQRIKIVGIFKVVAFLTLLMLIATRLTWLQTSAVPVEVTSTFYRTGILAAPILKDHCKEPIEATFPLPVEMALRPTDIPPPPELGEMSPGLILVMLARCQFAALEVEDFARWNAWLFLAATIFSAVATRLLTRSWIAGLLGAVAILSRGTVQSKSMVVSAEPFASVFCAMGFCYLTLFLRTFWRGWLVASTIALFCVALFCPQFTVTYGVCLIVLVYLAIRALLRVSTTTSQAIQIFVPQPASAKISNHIPVSAALLGILSLVCTGFMLFNIYGQLVSVSDLSLGLWKNLVNNLSSHAFIATYVDQLHSVLQRCDMHTILCFFLILVTFGVGGQLTVVNRAISKFFIATSMPQILIICILFFFEPSYWQGLVVSGSKLMEPFFFSWTTGIVWRLANHFTGNLLTEYGWSIRGRGIIEH